MRNRVFVFGAVAMFAFLTAAIATDLNGKWKGDMKTPNGDSLEINFNFQVNGEKLTGTVANTYGEEQITDGTVKGDAISFVILAGGGQFRIVYKGKVVGDDLKFNVTIGDMGEGELTFSSLARESDSPSERPAAGSSRSRTRGRPISASARSSRL